MSVNKLLNNCYLTEFTSTKFNRGNAKTDHENNPRKIDEIEIAGYWLGHENLQHIRYPTFWVTVYQDIKITGLSSTLTRIVLESP